MLWPDRPLQRGPLGRARFIPPWGRAVEAKKLKVVRETGWGSGSNLQDTPSLCFLPPVPSPLPSSASGGGVLFRGRFQMRVATALPPKVGGNQTALCHPGLCHLKQLCPRQVCPPKDPRLPPPPPLHPDSLRGGQAPEGQPALAPFTCTNMCKPG